MASVELRFTAPRMDWEHIMTILNTELDLEIKKSDLNPGDVDKLIEVYSAIVYHLCDGLDSIQQPRFKDIFQSIEDLDSALTVLQLLSIITSILTDISCCGFCLEDLVLPNPKRTQEFLSQILNFCVFSVEREEAGKKLMDHMQEWHDKLQRLRTDAPVMQRQLNDITADILHAQNVNENIAKKMNELNVTLKAGLNSKTEAQKRSKETNSDIKKLLEEKRTFEDMLKTQEENLQRLQMKIAESPEQLEKKKTACMQTIARLKSDCVKGNALLESRKLQIENFSKSTKEALSLHDLLKSITEEMDFGIKMTADLQTIEQTKQTVISEVKDVDEAHALLVKKFKTVSEEVAAIEHQQQMQDHRSQLAIQDARTLKEKRQKNLKENEKARINIYKTIKKYQENVRNVREAINRTEQDAQSIIQSSESLDVFHAALITHFQKIEETIKIMKAKNMAKVLSALKDELKVVALDGHGDECITKND